MFTRGSLLSFVVLFNLPIFTQARRGGGGSGPSIDINLDLSSISTTSFSFNIIFAVFTTFQALGAINILRSKHPDEHYPRRLIFTTLILFAALSLVAYYVIGAIIISTVYKETGPPGDLSDVVFAMEDFTVRLAHMFITGSLLLLMDARPYYNLLGSQSESSRNNIRNIKRGIDMALISLLVISNALTTSFLAVRSTSSLDLVLLYNLYTGFLRVHVATYVLISLNILITSILLWRPPNTSEIDEIFRTKILKLIMITVAPFILLRSLFNLGEHIALYTIDYDIEVLTLVETIVEGVLYFVVIGSCLHLGPKHITQSEPEEGSDKSLKH